MNGSDDDLEMMDMEEEHTKRPATDEQIASQSASLTELLMMMDEYGPVVPDGVLDYYMAKAGFQCDDVRVKRLMGLAAQKFVADIAADAFAYGKLKQHGVAAKDKRGQGAKGADKKMVLTMEDLSAALAEQGVNVSRPEYYH